MSNVIIADGHVCCMLLVSTGISFAIEMKNI